jgi:hypothetical protein
LIKVYKYQIKVYICVTKANNMTTAQLIQIATNKGYAIAKVKPGIYQYSTNGYEWTNVNCSWSEFVKLIQSL